MARIDKSHATDCTEYTSMCAAESDSRPFETAKKTYCILIQSTKQAGFLKASKKKRIDRSEHAFLHGMKSRRRPMEFRIGGTINGTLTVD